MEAEEILKSIKEHIERELSEDYKCITSPTMYDPNEMQYDVSFFILEKVKDSYIPKFTINVKDNTKRNFN